MQWSRQRFGLAHCCHWHTRAKIRPCPRNSPRPVSTPSTNGPTARSSSATPRPPPSSPPTSTAPPSAPPGPSTGCGSTAWWGASRAGAGGTRRSSRVPPSRPSYGRVPQNSTAYEQRRGAVTAVRGGPPRGLRRGRNPHRERGVGTLVRAAATGGAGGCDDPGPPAVRPHHLQPGRGDGPHPRGPLPGRVRTRGPGVAGRARRHPRTRRARRTGPRPARVAHQAGDGRPPARPDAALPRLHLGGAGRGDPPLGAPGRSRRLLGDVLAPGDPTGRACGRRPR